MSESDQSESKRNDEMSVELSPSQMDTELAQVMQPMLRSHDIDDSMLKKLSSSLSMAKNISNPKLKRVLLNETKNFTMCVHGMDKAIMKQKRRASQLASNNGAQALGNALVRRSQDSKNDVLDCLNTTVNIAVMSDTIEKVKPINEEQKNLFTVFNSCIKGVVTSSKDQIERQLKSVWDNATTIKTAAEQDENFQKSQRCIKLHHEMQCYQKAAEQEKDGKKLREYLKKMKQASEKLKDAAKDVRWCE